jgi:hypothetical protein
MKRYKIENMNVMKKIGMVFLFWVALCFTLNAKNPLIWHVYAADPSAHVWPEDTNTLWLYTSHDVPGTNTHATMFNYRVFSTKDLVNWTDHGQVLSVDNVDWAISHAWAIDAVYRHGKYYLIYCMNERETSIFRTGVAVSDVPQGPFTDIGFIKGVDWGQDPALFVDDDNTPYLFWGCGGGTFAAELNDDLMSVKRETIRDLKDELFEVFEGPWVHTYQGKYYLSYPGLPNGKWPEVMYYATADAPLGPYTYKGIYIPEFKGQAGTNHGSIIQFKGRWIAFHHSSWVSGRSETRSIMADWLTYRPDGTINTIIPDSAGLFKGKETKCVIHLEAENGFAAGGRMDGVEIGNSGTGFSGKGYVTGFDKKNDYVEVLVQVAKDTEASLKICLSSDKEYAANLFVGPVIIKGKKESPKPKTNGFEKVDWGTIQLKEGNNMLRFNCLFDAGVKVDYFEVTPLKQL